MNSKNISYVLAAIIVAMLLFPPFVFRGANGYTVSQGIRLRALSAENGRSRRQPQRGARVSDRDRHATTLHPDIRSCHHRRYISPAAPQQKTNENRRQMQQNVTGARDTRAYVTFVRPTGPDIEVEFVYTSDPPMDQDSGWFVVTRAEALSWRTR